MIIQLFCIQTTALQGFYCTNKTIQSSVITLLRRAADSRDLTLLAHLVGVPGRLVVIGEGNDGRAHPQYHRGMDLTVCVGGTVGVLLVLL